jgi:hypothetical protein
VKSRHHTIAAGLAAIVATVALAAGFARAQPYPGDRPAPYYPPPPPSEVRHSDPYYCDLYARNQAHRYSAPGAGALEGAAKGAIGGAIFGAIVGGSKGAKRGALAGGGLGAVAKGAQAKRDREYAYRYAYDDCMRGFRR